MSTQANPPWETFSPETIRNLMAAVDIDDVVDPVVSLPDPILLDYSVEKMQRCFALCLQLWTDGVVRSALLKLLDSVWRNGDLPETERKQYKDIRAKYKHLRFALVLYDKRHRPPWMFDVTIKTMGHLQDAFRNGDRSAVKRYTLWLRLLLSEPVWTVVSRRVGAVRFDTDEGYLAYYGAKIQRLEKALKQDMLTGDEFHALRKIVSAQVSFYDTLRSLTPNEHDYRMSRFLAAINGLMGSRHDEMVEQAISGEREYQTAATLDQDIRQRLETFVAHYPR